MALLVKIGLYYHMLIIFLFHPNYSFLQLISYYFVELSYYLLTLVIANQGSYYRFAPLNYTRKKRPKENSSPFSYLYYILLEKKRETLTFKVQREIGLFKVNIDFITDAMKSEVTVVGKTKRYRRWNATISIKIH